MSLGVEVATTTAVAGLARLLMQDGIEAPRQFFSRINGTLARPGGKRISHRVERTATEVLYFLFRCHIADKNPSVSDIYLATGLARGTTIRCIAGLRELGVLETSTDARDRRRSRVRFAKAYQRLIEEFSETHCQRLDDQLAASGFVHVKSRAS
jgi:DNA-binding MarR family transcriptional regulator